MTRPAKSKPVSVGDLLKSNDSGFARLLNIARRIEQLDVFVRAELDPRLADHVRVATLRGGELILVTPVAAIAARLRLESADLVARLRNRGLDNVETVRVRVAPFGPSDLDHRRDRRLSPAARDALERYARDAGDKAMRERLKRSKRD